MDNSKSEDSTFPKKFDVILADPPWSFGDKLNMSSVKRGADAHYATLSLEGIKNIRVKDWTSDDSILALWVPSSMLADGLAVMESWGFKQKQIYTWVKTTKNNKIAFGMGRFFRGATEHALIGTRGKPKPASKSERNVDLSQVLAHSAKPELLHRHMEAMFPEASKLELFARRSVAGWACVGLECPDINADLTKWEPKFMENSNGNV